jgi:predicted nuclease of predicted toxin-antitoxin system
MPDDIALLLDENVPLPLEAWLQERLPTSDVLHVLHAGLAGKSDTEVFRFAQAQERVIITFDEDLADARMFPLGSHHGVVRLRIWPITTESTIQALNRLLMTIPLGDWKENLIIIENQQIRLRRKPSTH